MTATPTPGTTAASALGKLRRSILTAMAELADAQEETTLALRLLLEGMPMDEAATLDAVLPTLEAAQRDIALTLAELRLRQRVLAAQRGEAVAPPSVIPFPNLTTGGPDAVA